MGEIAVLSNPIGKSVSDRKGNSTDHFFGKVDKRKSCGVVCIGMREDTHINVLPSPEGLVLEMERERSGWTS
jgi:predicted secreted protein